MYRFNHTTVLEFGKYKNLTAETVLSKDPNYIIWLDSIPTNRVSHSLIEEANRTIEQFSEDKEVNKQDIEELIEISNQTLSDLDRQKEYCQREIDKLEQLTAPKHLPQEGGLYYRYNPRAGSAGTISLNVSIGDPTLCVRLSDAELLYQKQLLLRDMVNYIAVHAPDWEIDRDSDELKFGLYVCHLNNKVDVTFAGPHINFIFNLVVEHWLAHKMLAEFGERILKFY